MPKRRRCVTARRQEEGVGTELAAARRDAEMAAQLERQTL
jgi:hypothetical protein